MRLVWTERAVTDLADIEDDIARDDPAAALRFIDKLIARGEALREQPRKGRMVPELGVKDIRELVIGNYRLVYRVRSDRIEVLQVFEGHKLFSDDES